MKNNLINKIKYLENTLNRIVNAYSPVALASSLGAEDMVLTDLIYTKRLPVDVFTIDTGRLHEETHDFLNAIALRYTRHPRVVMPRTDAVGAYVASHGENAFYRSVELRKACCHVRKVEPLSRA